MNIRVSWSVFFALMLSCASCSDSDGNSSEDTLQFNAGVTATNSTVPIISKRYYVDGSARVTVTGAFQVDEAIPINTQASFSDGEMTWLQYGASGSEEPNALVTVSPDEVGFNVGRGRPTATAGADICTGSTTVTGNSVTGHYSCQNVTSYDPRNGEMGTVNIEIEFSAIS
jgi:hypothetical protein